MNKAQALQKFWNSFGVSAYDESTVPRDTDLGSFYITYSVATDSLNNAVSLSASIWEKNSTSWKRVSEKADEISNALEKVKTIKLDVGYLYITRGRPFAQRMTDTNDTTRRIYINIMAEFLTP